MARRAAWPAARWAAALLLAAALLPPVRAAEAAEPPAFVARVHMERPHTRRFQVELECRGLPGPAHDFKLPVWTPGFYQILDYPKYVSGFRAEDGDGRPLPWEKTAKNVWRVRTGGASRVVIRYEVLAPGGSIAHNALEERRGYIVPAALFMHVAGMLDRPVEIELHLFREWTDAATGLDPLPAAGGEDALVRRFRAPDFDTLYDSPMLLGRLDAVRFEVRGVPHAYVALDLRGEDRGALADALRRIVETTAAIFGELPYRHYTFLEVGPGDGGLEHANSCALSYDPSMDGAFERDTDWLALVAHEYFHVYNVKHIRPEGLGPFDYDREVYTPLLWVAEGWTQYYENLILARAGLIDLRALLDALSGTIAAYETLPGRLRQSAAAASFDTWLNEPFGLVTAEAGNDTISYYDKGAALAMLLDFKIRVATGGTRSLDDVLRALYRDRARPYAEARLRELAAQVAGVPVDELFDLAASTREIDYATYLEPAGLRIRPPRETDDPWLGIVAQVQPEGPVVVRVDRDGPADRGGLAAGDRLLALDEEPLTTAGLSVALRRRAPGERVRLRIRRSGEERTLDLTLGRRIDRSFRLDPAPRPTEVQARLLEAWSGLPLD